MDRPHRVQVQIGFLPARDRDVEVDLVDGFLQLRDGNATVRTSDRSVVVTGDCVVQVLRQACAIRSGLPSMSETVEVEPTLTQTELLPVFTEPVADPA
jgi:hypothetical protein